MATITDAAPPPATTGAPIGAGERSSDFIDVGGILLAFRRRLWLFLPVALILAAIVLAAYFFVPPRYDAVAQVQVNTEQEKVVSTQQVVSSEAPDTYAVDTQVQVLKSRTVARATVLKLKLYANADFAGDFTVAANQTRGDAFDRAVDAATDTVIADRAVSRSGLAFVIDIAYSARDPRTAMLVANTLAEQYVQAQLGGKIRGTQSATSWLSGRLAGLRQQVLAAETAVQRYRSANGLLNTSPTETTTQQTISGINNELATAQADLAERRARAATARAQLQSGSVGDDVGEALGSQVITQLRQQRAEVSRQLADYQTRYGPRHPDYIRARSQLTDIDAQIQAEIRRVISSLDAQARSSAGRVASLQGNVDRSEGTLAANSAAGVRLADLERSADAVRTLYQTYLNRFRETSSQQGLETPDSRVLTYASEPADRAAPKLTIFVALALVAGLLGGSVAVALAEALDHGLRSSTGVRNALGLRTLASIPDYRSTLERSEARNARTLRSEVVIERPFSAFTESFRMLRAALYDRSTGKPYQVVALSSALPREGKSTSAVCLARVAAAGGERTVLVECDVRREGVRASRSDTQIGILEVLAGEVPLDRALQLDEASGAYILPISKRTLTPADVLGADAMDRLLVDLRQRFDFIVLDTAPTLAVAETRVLATKADAVAVLVRWGRTPERAAAAGVQQLRESGANVVGVVLTQVDLKTQRNWGREDAAAYYGDFKQYYTA